MAEMHNLLNDNEKAQKQGRKYRATYWASNVIDEELFKLINKDF